eukprot:TRINITY_DN597_c0_g1_i2.p1 TRINITY_DN597_c0_g1~~TRINITY_DN597_c0_g1_i2.p1  ORF type:complete len:331 (-),score=72.70 TRINITY_DN597_c0_g1_i2:21-1013(-)
MRLLKPIRYGGILVRSFLNKPIDAKDGMIFNSWAKSVQSLSETKTDVVDLKFVNGLVQTFPFNHDMYNKLEKKEDEQIIIPPMSHYLFCCPYSKSLLDLDSDGFENLFSPPAPYQLRLWGGTSTSFLRPITAGMELQQTIKVKQAQLKQGRSGSFIVETLSNDWLGKGKSEQIFSPVLSEDINFIYRHIDSSKNLKEIEQKKELNELFTSPICSKEVTLNTVHLFRYSSLTFNSHKIHFDHLYATQKEQHEGILVHGPLQATLLINFFKNNNNTDHKTITHFSYKALSPLALIGDEVTFTLNYKIQDANHYLLWIESKGRITMSGDVRVV